MASIVITLPGQQSLVVSLPSGDQIIPITIRECVCKCGLWFQPNEPHQTYYAGHQQAARNEKNRKTERRQKT